jgi:Outer membrane protein beta-barrel domain
MTHEEYKMKKYLVLALVTLSLPLAAVAQNTSDEVSTDHSEVQASDDSTELAAEDSADEATDEAINSDEEETVSGATVEAEESEDIASDEADAPARYTPDTTTDSGATTSLAPATESSRAQAPAASTAPAATTATASVQEAQPSVAGDLRAPSPKVLDPNRRGYFQLGVGPAYGAAMKTDSLMYNVIGSYNFNLSDDLTAKAIADFYVASGEISSRLLNYGVGAEYYLRNVKIGSATPYIGADAGLGFARNAKDDTATGLTLGAGAGFKFQARELNFDINAHYAQLTAEVGGNLPALFAVRGSVAF